MDEEAKQLKLMIDSILDLRCTEDHSFIYTDIHIHSTASLRVASEFMISICITVSGERRPWAVGKDGRVSLDDKTELERGAPF